MIAISQADATLTKISFADDSIAARAGRKLRIVGDEPETRVRIEKKSHAYSAKSASGSSTIDVHTKRGKGTMFVIRSNESRGVTVPPP